MKLYCCAPQSSLFQMSSSPCRFNAWNGRLFLLMYSRWKNIPEMFYFKYALKRILISQNKIDVLKQDTVSFTMRSFWSLEKGSASRIGFDLHPSHVWARKWKRWVARPDSDVWESPHQEWSCVLWFPPYLCKWGESIRFDPLYIPIY